VSAPAEVHFGAALHRLAPHLHACQGAYVCLYGGGGVAPSAGAAHGTATLTHDALAAYRDFLLRAGTPCVSLLIDPDIDAAAAAADAL
jgi:hypothetical protein